MDVTYLTELLCEAVKDNLKCHLGRNPPGERKKGRGNEDSVAPSEEFFGSEAAANH